MKIKWLGHASFLISSDSGTRIITDPYISDENIKYGEIRESADVVTVSHDHFDHNNVDAVKGSPEVVRGTAEAKGISFKGIPTHHDAEGGSERGDNTIICFEVDGIRVCHLGDLGHTLGKEEVAAMGEVDVALVPVGGFFTIDAAAAREVCSQIEARVVIPMHFKTEKLNFPIAGVDEFLSGEDNVTRLEVSELELHKDKLPDCRQVTVLHPAL